MDKIYIYTLADPRTGEIRYIGKTNNLTTRYRHHLNKRRYTHAGNWIYSLSTQNLYPIIEQLDVVDREYWRETEKYWISQFKTWGFKLTNFHEGGEGNGGGHKLKHVTQLGRKASLETRIKQSLSQKARDHSYKQGRKISEQAKLNRLGIFAGENNGSAKLTNQQVIVIRERLVNKEQGYVLANVYNVSQSAISAIKNKRTFRFIG